MSRIRCLTAPQTDKLKLSVTIPTFNEEHNIGECLQRVAWADELIVLDSLSTDRTLEIARQHTPKVFQRPFMGDFLDTRRYSIGLCSNDWVLCLDADEFVTPELAEEIRQKLTTGDPEVNGYYLNRRVFHLGRWIDHCGWYPNYRLRLFRKSKARVEGTQPHDRIEVDGKTEYLKHDIEHRTYRNLADQLKKIDRFSGWFAECRFKEGARAGPVKIISHSIAKFLRVYVLKLGFLDGFPGFVIAVLATYHTFLKYVKLWELGRQPMRDER
ncbi:MAG: glycosyltransferase family 2 protein [Planctomycetes bacterium]|nr:glycosyltransferase family 2 protein [Planctomycetota bacterium]